MLIEVDFNSDEAIYVQLCNQIIMGIATSVIQEGDSLPSVRQLADTIGVNMHTVNKAYSVLKREGYISLDKRRGAVIALDIDKMEQLEEMRRQLRIVLARGCCKNISRQEVHNLVDEIYRKTMNVNASEFGIRSELELIIANLRKALAYYGDELEKVLDESGEESFIRSLVEAERVIRDYREGLGALDTPEAEEKYRTVDGYAGAVKQAKADFNACITAFYDELEDFSPADIEFSKEYLLFT